MGIKYKVNENFFVKWSDEMAYVLGYVYADGHLIYSPKMRGKYFNISSVDHDSILRVKELLESEHTIKKTKSHFIGSKTCYVLRIGNHKIYDDLIKLGVYQNKSLTVRMPKIPKKYLSHFIRGYFDGDGCIYFETSTGKDGQKIIKRIRTIFTSGSKKFLEDMNELLSKIGLKGGKIYYSQRAFQLRYPTTDSVKIFEIMYRNTSINSFFMRKFKIFKNYFELRPQWATPLIRRIIDTHK